MADQNIYIDSSVASAGNGSTPETAYKAFSDINWDTGGANSIFDWVAVEGTDVFINITGTFAETLTVGESGV